MKPKFNKSLLLIDTCFNAPLSKAIKKEYNALASLIDTIPSSGQSKKNIEGPGGLVSINNLIAYQIGWGKSIIDWYKTGLKKQPVQMPGHVFDTWNYVGLAQLFYKKYQYDSGIKQKKEFLKTVLAILEIVEHEYIQTNLDKSGVWDWCTLTSGKKWPLSKWIQVNTVAPYKRARALIKKSFKD